MTSLKVRIVRVWDTDWYPGMAECFMVDAFGVKHYFQDKRPIFSDRELTPDMLPCDGALRCSQCTRSSDALIQIDTEFPDHVASKAGEHLFYVSPCQLNVSCDLIDAHRFSSSHRAQLPKDQSCGCFFCLSIFDPKEIDTWLEPEATAICPYCGVDTIIGRSSDYPITKEFLQKMRELWF